MLVENQHIRLKTKESYHQAWEFGHYMVTDNCNFTLQVSLLEVITLYCLWPLASLSQRNEMPYAIQV